MPSHAHFEIDIISALSSQLVEAFVKLEVGALDGDQIDLLPKGQGVYQLYHQGLLVYVGKADRLANRLRQHQFKINGRHNIDVADMGFKCLFIHRNWTALAPEDSLIRHYREAGQGQCVWNGNGFGPHDPGRDRETTEKRPDGFDSQYPIRKDWKCDWVKAGQYDANDLLSRIKGGLPYLLRYETEKKRSNKPHADHIAVPVRVPQDDMTAEDLLRTIAQALPGWQATAFPSHMILYKESRRYAYGDVIWPA